MARSLVALTITARQGEIDRERALRSTRAGEKDQQVQVHISGEGADGWGYADIAVSWEHPFVYSPLQRDPPFTTPHVTGNHIELTTGTGGLLIATAHVIGWTRSPQGWFIGATVRVAVAAPGASDPVPYTGIVHLTFQSYAFPTDEEP